MEINTLTQLGLTITSELENNKLIDLKNILENYTGQDWKEYVSFCCQKYKRNLVFINQIVEILIICWEDGQKSGIHDHTENGCLLRMMEGRLQEDIYMKNSDTISLVQSNSLEKDNISYKQGNVCLHNIINESGNQSVSLHIYSPPNYKTTFYL